jgi:hypothetical protein
MHEDDDSQAAPIVNALVSTPVQKPLPLLLAPRDKSKSPVSLFMSISPNILLSLSRQTSLCKGQKETISKGRNRPLGKHGTRAAAEGAWKLGRGQGPRVERVESRRGGKRRNEEERRGFGESE